MARVLRGVDLYRSLVIEQGLVEFLQGGYADHRDPYLFAIVSRVKKDGDLERVRQEIEAAIEKVARGKSTRRSSGM